MTKVTAFRRPNDSRNLVPDAVAFYHQVMGLATLLVGADDNARSVLRNLLEELNISVQCAGDFADAHFRVQKNHFDAIFLDCGNEAGARLFISELRDSTLNTNTLTVAMVEPLNHVREILAAGAGVVLYKPISRERTNNSIRAVRDLIRGERRVHPRVPVNSAAAVDYAGREGTPSHLLNLSKEGIAFQSERELAPCCKVYFQFSLPGSVSVVRLAGEVMWQDSAGRVGLRLAHVPQSSRRILQDWLQNTPVSPRTDDALVSASDITANSLSRGAKVGAGLVSDRRDPGRKPCSLGVDVYIPSRDVPHRCTLTDVSHGGCYVETTTPFPVGTAVDIVIRTAESKLSLPGTVQKTDPGFGMGVKFVTLTERNKKHIAELVECVDQESKFTN